MRRFIPRKTDLATLSKHRFRRFVAIYNHTPRKCLDFKTPAEAFSEVLHFECESSSLLSQGRRCWYQSDEPISTFADIRGRLGRHRLRRGGTAAIGGRRNSRHRRASARRE